MCDTHWFIFKNVRIVNLWVQHMCASHLIWKNIDTFMWNEMVLVRNFNFHFPDDQIGNVLKSTVFRTNSAPIFRPFETVLLEPMQFLVAIPSMFIDIDFMYPSHWNCVQQRLVQWYDDVCMFLKPHIVAWKLFYSHIITGISDDTHHLFWIS